MRERGMSAEEADRLLQGHDASEVLAPFVTARAEDLAVGIDRAAAFLQSSTRSNAGLTRLFTSGGGARIPGLGKSLADRLRLPVQQANPIERLQVADGVFDAMNVDEVATMLMLRSASLSGRSRDPPPRARDNAMMISVNLRPGTKRAKARSSLSARLDWFKGLGSMVQDPLKAAAVVGWVAVAGFLGWAYLRTGSQLGSLEPRVEQLRWIPWLSWPLFLS